MFNNFNKFRARVALIGEQKEKITYQNLITESDKINKILKKTSLILLICNNSVSSIYGYVSFLRNNHTTIIADASFNKNYLEDIIKIYRPKYIFSEKNFFFEKKYLKVIYNINNFSLFENSKFKKDKINKKNYILLSTSGSTSNPKFVRISKNNLLDNTKKNN